MLRDTESVFAHGAVIVPDFVTPAEEERILLRIAQAPWMTELRRRVQHYGYRYSYTGTSRPVPAAPFPRWAEVMADRLLPHFGGALPVQCIVNEYRPGQGIGMHADHRDFGPVVASLSLAADCEGAIGVICSDHQPQGTDAKLAPFAEADPGISGVDTLLAMTLKLVHQGQLPLSTAIAALTTNPAAIIGIDAGHLGLGARADLCLFDPALEWLLETESMHSNGKNSPWFGHTINGRVVTTLIDGKVVYRHQSGH